MKSVQLMKYVRAGLLSVIAASLVAIAPSSFSPYASAFASPPQFDLSEIKSHFASFENHRIHYKSHGTGDEALVFIHGGVGNMNIWRLQVPAFKDKKRIILIDLPGHGQSDKPRITYSMDVFARAIDAVLTEAKVKKAVLIGISMGTPVIRQFYRLYPEKTKALVFIDGPLRPLAPTDEIGQEFIAQFRGPDYMESAKRFNAGLMTAKIPADMREQILACWANTPQHVILSVLEQVTLPNAAPAIWKQDQIKVPVLAVYTKNFYVPEDNEQFLRSMAPATEYHAWGDVGHAVMVEKPDEFNETLQNFLAKQKILSAEAANRLWPFHHVQLEPVLEDQFEEALRGKAQAFNQAHMGYEQSWFVTHRPMGNYTIARPLNSFSDLDRLDERLGLAEKAIGKAKFEELNRKESSAVRATCQRIELSAGKTGCDQTGVLSFDDRLCQAGQNGAQSCPT